MKSVLFVCTLWPILAFAQTPASQGQTLRGGGLEVRADLSGWTQTEGPAVFGGTYVRLGNFTKSNDRMLSILVDRTPPGVTDLESLCQHATKSYGGATGLKMLQRMTVAGKAGCLFTFPTAAQRRNFYVEMLFGDRWLELHYSAPDGGKSVELGSEVLESVVISLSAKPYNNAPGELLQADITDAEVAMVEHYQGCNAKSKDFICRSLAAFKSGARPSGRPIPVGFAGISLPIFFDRSLAGVVVVPETAGFIVVSDTTIGTGNPQPSKERERASKELIGAIKAGKPLPSGNLIVEAARSATESLPAVLAERSMMVPSGGTGKLYLRETSIGLVCLGLLPGPQGTLVGALLEVYPKP